VTRAETAALLRAGSGMLRRAGISQSTVARALGLHQAEVSLWLNHRQHGFRVLSARQVRFLRFLAALRRAQALQDAASVLAACDDRRYAPQAWHHDSSGRVRFGPPESEGGAGSYRERRTRVLL
jgi:hypothetical protein